MSTPPTARELAASVMDSDEVPARVIDWPGRVPRALRAKLADRRVALVVLSRQDKLDAQIEATRYLLVKQQLDAVQFAMLQPEGCFEFEREIQLLSKFLREPGSLDMEAFSADELRGALSTEQQEALMRAYNAYERDESPLTQVEDPEKAKAYLRSLKAAGGLSTFLQCCDFGTGSAIAHALAELWLEPASASSSDT